MLWYITSLVSKAFETGMQVAKRAALRRKKSDKYHHGDLRRDLLRIAREEIARSGAATVSLSSLARLAGVSQPAPYRHFADREALLESVAGAGFEEFDQVLAEAVVGRKAEEALQTMAVAYLQFGEANIELYRLMFASRLVPDAGAGNSLAKAADEAFARLQRTMSEISPPASVERDTLLVWAQLHGLVMLRADGFIDQTLSQFLNSPPPIGKSILKKMLKA